MRLRTAFAAVALSAASTAAPSQAAVSVSSFAVTPSSLAAGAHPDVTVDVKLQSTGTDSLKDASVSLAAGLIANPSAATICSSAAFQADMCPDSSKIGDGSINATALAFATAISLPIGVYLIAPQGSEIARIGVIADLFDFPVASVSAPIELRTSPDVGIDIPLMNIPDDADGSAIQVNELTLDLSGTVNGQPFTRNPTACDAAETKLTVDSYDAPTTPVAADSSFTPTGCASLTYMPKVTADATVDSADSGVAFAAHVTQNAGDATTSSITMTLPDGLAPRLGTLLNACTATDPSTCPAVGSASVSSPLLASPVNGKLVLVAQGGTNLPEIDAVFGAPLSFILQGTPHLTGSGVSATFSGIPDVPITELDVTFAGGPNSAFAAGPTLCSSPQTLTADLTGANGATVHLTPTVAVHGSCSSGQGATAGKPTGRLVISHLLGRHGAVKVTLSEGTNAPGLKRVAITLPRGLSAARRALHRTLNVPKRQLTITLKRPALKLAAGLIKKLRHHRKVKLTASVSVTDAAGTATRLHLTKRLT